MRKKAEGLYNEYMFDLTIHGAPVYEHATGEPVPGEDHCYLDHQVSARAAVAPGLLCLCSG